MNKIEKYISECPETHHEKLNEMYQFLKENVPEETIESIKWAMPTFELNGNLVHFAMGKHHIGLYPGASGVECVKSELEELGLKHSKGAIQFPLNQPLNKDLILKILKYRIEENQS